MGLRKREARGCKSLQGIGLRRPNSCGRFSGVVCREKTERAGWHGFRGRESATESFEACVAGGLRWPRHRLTARLRLDNCTKGQKRASVPFSCPNRSYDVAAGAWGILLRGGGTAVCIPKSVVRCPRLRDYGKSRLPLEPSPERMA